ncbi:MAG: hypothetical protein QNI84_12970 [Henriciella sp.]|nr:hypothetical protein [Henriciella sp.]
MFQEDTLIIVGAGASKEANLPLGSELAEKLAHSLFFWFGDFNRLEKGENAIFAALKNLSKDHEELQEFTNAARQIAQGVRHARSIDNFVETHDQDQTIQKVAKLGIAYELIQAERRSSLFGRKEDHYPWEINDPHAMKTWYQAFFEISTNGIKKSNLDMLFSNVAVICFNYDRTLEQFLLLRLQQLYAIDEAEAARLVTQLRVIRPYGWLGSLPSMSHEHKHSFGKVPHHEKLPGLAERIITYGEQVSDTKVTSEMAELAAQSSSVVFLGFGFHNQNMELVFQNPQSGQHRIRKRVFLTNYGVSLANTEAIQNRISTSLYRNGLSTGAGSHFVGKPWVGGDSTTCAQFLNDHREMLQL